MTKMGGGGRRNVLTGILLDMGFKPKEFVRDVLGLNYQTYLYRVRKGQLKDEDYKKILTALNMTYEQVFWRDRVRQQPIISQAPPAEREYVEQPFYASAIEVMPRKALSEPPVVPDPPAPPVDNRELKEFKQTVPPHEPPKKEPDVNPAPTPFIAEDIDFTDL